MLAVGEGWYKDGLFLQLTGWDGDQTITFALHNYTEQDVALDALDPLFVGLPPPGQGDDPITIRPPTLAGPLAVGQQRLFQIALSVDPVERSIWPYMLLLVKDFGPIKEARWLLPIVNTPTPTFTPGPTGTPTPTITPTPTATPLPDTPPGSVLKIGDTWRQDGMSMRVDSLDLKASNCCDGFNCWAVWGIWHAVIKNETDHELVVDIDRGDFVLTDNRDQGAGLTLVADGYGSCAPNPVWGNGSVGAKMLEAGQEMGFRVYGTGDIGDREWYRFGVIEAGRLQNARWQFDIPR